MVDRAASEGAEAAFEPGDRLGPFVLREPLGQGGMGVVYRAEDERMRREVALKVLRPDAANDPDRGRRLWREARTAGAVSHPNVAVIYEIGEADGRLFVAMELIEGESLAQRIERGPLPSAQAIAVALQVLDALACAHSVGIIHRDLKPANVMLGPRGVVKVLDFGIAARLWSGLGMDVTESTLTAEGRIVGTPAYMAPEQARGQHVDQRADVFAFGVLLFEMLTGRRPFAGQNAADLMSAVLRDPPLSLAALRPETPPALVAVIERCLAKEPDARFSTCAEVHAELARAGDTASTTTPTSSGLPARIDPGPAAPAASSTADGPPGATARPDRHRRRWVIGVAAAAIIAAGLTLALSSGGEDPTTAAASPDAKAPGAGVAITDRPLPRSDKPDAIGAYAAALNAFRDANWSRATQHLQRAVALDPNLAAAHLRLAIVQGPHLGSREARASYVNAVEGRATLDAHDRAMLSALEPLLGVAEPDAETAAARWREVARAFPDDAEIALMAAFFSNDAHLTLEGARRAIELDPRYADAWQLQARALLTLGRVADAAVPLERCTAISPNADDCRMERAYVAGTQGDCALMEEHLRVMVARSQETYPYVLSERACALYALGRPDGAVLEALAQLWAQRNPAQRAERELTERALLDIARGRFDEAERKLVEGGRVVAADAPTEQRTDRAMVHALLLREVGRADEAAAIAEDFVSRRDAWIGVGAPDKEMVLLRLLLQAGRLSEEAFASRRAELLRRAGGSLFARDRWSVEHLVGITTAAEAEQARATYAQVAYEERAVLETGLVSNVFMGRFELLIGETARAVSTLQRATSGCWELRHALLYNAARLDLGRALEQMGRSEEACEAYRAVLVRWGHATPRSLTAEEAHARSNALGCRAP